MIKLKTAEDIEILRENNLLVSKVLALVGKEVKPGISTLRLDKLAEEYIRDHGAEPGFLGYQGFPNTLCLSVNNQVVHGIPSEKELIEGDILSVDCGVKKNGYYGDSAYTFPVGEIKTEVKRLLDVTKESLMRGIEMAINGNRVGDIGYAIQKYVERYNYTVVREMVGHGLGNKLHEPPEVPNYGKQGSGTKLTNGMVLCIEPMINMGKRHIRQLRDKWTIVTADGAPSAHYELAIAVNDKKPDILSTFKYIEEDN
jgi:methionyl aminopeptidase